MGFQLKDLDSTKVIELKSGDIVGRSQGNHQFPNSSKMSRSHCQFLIEGNIAYIIDLNSRNGTFINSVKIVSNKKTLIGDGHILMFGEKTFIIKGGSAGIVNTMIPGVTNEAGGTYSAPIKSFAFSFKAVNSELYMLIFKNVFFTLVTLGFYIPYARTNLRKLIWKSTSLNSFPFMFKGNPQALFKSYMILFVLFLGMSGLKHVISLSVIQGNHSLEFIQSIVSSAFLFVLFMWARFAAYSYLVNNTSYRSVSFRMKKGGAKEHLISSIMGTILSFLTIGLYYPFMACRLDRIRWNLTSYGNKPMTYFGEGKDYFKICFKGLFLTLITAGLYYPWFAVSIHQFKIDHLEFGSATFTSKAKGGEYFWVLLKSTLLMIFTLGLAAPFVFNLNLAYFIDHTSIKGSLDFNAIVSEAKVAHSGLGDSIADVFDLDVDIGMS